MDAVLQTRYCFNTIALPDLREVAESCQKQLPLIINPLPYREIHSHCVQLRSMVYRKRILISFLTEILQFHSHQLAAIYSCHSTSKPIISLHVTKHVFCSYVISTNNTIVRLHFIISVPP